MELVLGLKEFFATALLLQADAVHGMNLVAEVPPPGPDRQLLYEDGERELARRDLLRQSGQNEVQFREDFKRIMITVMHPLRVCVAMETIVEQGLRVIVLYARGEHVVGLVRTGDGSFVMHELPDTPAAIDYLMSLLVPVSFESNGIGARIPMDSFIQAIQLRLDGHTGAAANKLLEFDAPEAIRTGLAHAVRDMQFSTTISVFPAIKGAGSEHTRETGILRTGNGVWIMLPSARNDGTVLVQSVNREQLTGLLDGVVTVLKST